MLKKVKEIEGLKWLPWIGNHFSAMKENRILIIGESHYHDNSEESIEKHESPLYTQKVIKELAIERKYWKTKIFPNFHKAIMGNDSFNSNDFWNLLSFYNFIQKPMNTNNGRPTKNDFYQGWFSFFKVIEILKPNTCIFIGTESTNSFQKAILESNYKIELFERDEKISGVYPKRAVLIDSQDNKIELYFIKHTSKYFSWEKWNSYLQNQMTKQINWLKNEVSTKGNNV